MWENTYAAIYRARKDVLRPVVELDEIELDALFGIEKQKEALVKNTLNFIEDRGGNHALLWGAKGTGKSSLIKAVFNAFKDRGLRLVEVAKDDLRVVPDLMDELRTEPFKFILFCDDFSFEEGDDSYKFLKPLMDGSIEKAPKNILIYASSNRRHLLSERLRDNEEFECKDGQLHASDASEEKLSLSDRFGLWLSFYQGGMEDYLRVVDLYFRDFKGDRAILHARAKEFASLRASHSARTAKQFYLAYCGLWG